MTGRRILVTGGAGYVGSHLVEVLLHQGNTVRVVDNLSTGSRANLAAFEGQDGFEFVEGDLLGSSIDDYLDGCGEVFHLAASQDVRTALTDTRRDVDQNIRATYRLLEAMRRTDTSRLGFASTSTVYGEARTVPTPEDYAPMAPLSLYGASKLAGEALISAFSHTFGLQAVVYRFANIVGGRATHGVVYDLFAKLQDNREELEILGRRPGTRKSYVYVDDAIAGMLAAWEASQEGCEVYNVGTEDQINVEELADAVSGALGLEGVRYRWTGGVDEGRGWRGDVRDMWLDIRRLKALGWRPYRSSHEAVDLAVKDLAKQDQAG
ncbi:MAG: NAD-dependent epimerase/dehydratase family protein [Candidatus Thermoplasmatota archaeon]|nr:NAD-dependent epimerase/dehydratase family protein [Candidatus Thermoplasmatota archaeon]